MYDSEYEEQVKTARTEQSRTPQSIDDSIIILSKPQDKIFHSLKFRAQTDEEIAFQNKELHHFNVNTYHIGDATKVHAARSFFDFGIPYLDADEQSIESLAYDNVWHRETSFRWLTEHVENGQVPSDTFGDMSSEPEPYNKIMERARAEGYDIPDKFLEPKNVRQDKKNAIYAARDLKSRQIHFVEDNNKNQMITSIKTGFLVPDPDDESKFPLVLDQLWVIQEENAKLRFIGVEIVSSLDLTDEKNFRARVRAEKLARQGIELYRIAGWWCQIDAWRALTEMMFEADVFPYARNQFGYPVLNKTSDYICSHCEQPMIRFDSNWVEACRAEYVDYEYVELRTPRYMHPKCVEEVLDPN